MNRFTLRSALVLAVVLLLAGATTSFAQVIFAASAGNPQVRVGGITEAVGDVTLSSTNGGTVAGTGAVTPGPNTLVITLTYSTTITNKSLAGTNVVGNLPAGATATLAIPAATTLGMNVAVNNITVGGAAATNVAWQASGSTLTLTITNVAAAAGIAFNNGGAAPVGVNTTITIHGVRLNAAGLGMPPAIPTVSTFLNTAPSANLQLAAGSTSLTVGTLANALGSVSRLGGSTVSAGAEKFYSVGAGLVCSNYAAPACAAGTVLNTALTVNPKSSYTNCGFKAIPQGAAAGGNVVITGDDATGTIGRTAANDFGGNGGSNAIGIKIAEAYPGAFTSKGDEGLKSNAAEVDNGTRVRIDFSGLPAQVVVVGAERVLAANNPATMASGLSMDLWGATYCTAGAVPASCGTPHTAIGDVKSPSGGALTFEYEVTNNAGTTTGIASSIIIPFWLFRSSTPVDLTTINIAVTLGPRLGTAVVRFSDQQTASTATVAVTACSTDLFYPFVTNIAGFDTGLYVVNGGQTREGASGQSGACTARFFDGSTTGSTAVKSSTLPTLGPGQSYSFTASDATLGKPGFGNGYVQITCPFESAHGAAYVTFGFGTAAVGSAPPGTMYLALVGKPDSAISNR